MSTRKSTRLSVKITAATSVVTPHIKKIKVKEEILDEEKPVPAKRSRVKSSKGPVSKCVSVDIFVPQSIDFDVITVKGHPLTAMLNQTNLAQNNNKFFLIQALSRKDGRGFATWFRWGRVGYSGQTNLQIFPSLEAAISVFEAKFLDKTRNDWSETIYTIFESFIGKYTLLPVETLTRAMDDANGSVEILKVEVEPTKLEPELFNLIKLISSRDMLERELRVAGIDLTKMPLGQMSMKMIQDGYMILQKIESQLLKNASDRNIFIELSNQFFTVIPHNFGFTKGIMYVINTFSKLKEKTELLESLSQVIEAGQDLKQLSTKQTIVSTCPNPIDDHYVRMATVLSRVAPGTPVFNLIEKYKKNTQGETHSDRSKIRNVFEINMPNEKRKSTTLLWHGSRLTNWHSILSHGLKIAPPEAPHTGFMFDKGVYTADCFSKSANYCFSNNGVGLMVLCEVDLGKSLELSEADHNAKSKLGKTFHSTKGVGKYFPNPAEFDMLDGVVVPCGVLMTKDEPTVSKRTNTGGLLYNEYVVYDPNRIRMKYLVEIEFGR